MTYRDPGWEAERAAHPYRFDRTLREELRQQWPDQVRQIWVDDAPEWSPDPNLDVYDVVTALVVIGYETLHDHPILPSSVMIRAAKDIRIYGTGRYHKDPEDAAEYLMTRDSRPHINEFLRQVLGLVEDVHERGLHINVLVDAIDAEVEGMMQTAIRVSNRMDRSAYRGQLCTAVWQELLLQRMPPGPEAPI